MRSCVSHLPPNMLNLPIDNIGPGTVVCPTLRMIATLRFLKEVDIIITRLLYETMKWEMDTEDLHRLSPLITVVGVVNVSAFPISLTLPFLISQYHSLFGLCFVCLQLLRGKRLTVGRMRIMKYDHRDQKALVLTLRQ